VLEQVRRRYELVVVGYVLMPEHVHLLVSEPQQLPLATAIQALKLGFARRMIAQRKRHAPAGECDPFQSSPQHIWQARYYDFNVCTPEKRREKLRYMHRNPVKRGLVASPELWRWSSCRDYIGKESGIVRVNDWSVLKMKLIKPTLFPQ
jgi:putative transposase